MAVAVTPRLRALNPREASIFACLVDAYCEPGGALPPVAETTAALFLDDWLARAPGVNRAFFRGLLYVGEAGPILLGFGRRLRRLDRSARQDYLRQAERSRVPGVRDAVKLLKVATNLGYYGDTRVLERIGYDPDALLARSRELRASEGRP
jgi:hypothetical protein